MNRIYLVKIIIALTVLLTVAVAPAEDIWLEGEKPDVRPQGDLSRFGVSFGDAHPEWQSGGALLNMVLGYKKAKEVFPKEGLQFAYNFEVEEGGQYDLWLRLGFDFGRSDFDYRFDDGEWMTCEDSLNSIDMVTLMKFNPLTWAKLPSVTLQPGKHTITFRHLPFVDTNEKGEEVPSRNLHKLDVIFLTQDAFLPNGKYRPGEDYKNEQDREAAQKTYTLEEAKASAEARSAVRLDGLWEFARWDEWVVDEATRLEPPRELPDMDKIHWRGIKVPGNRNDILPEFTYAHRYVLRCKVDVPASLEEKGFFLELNNFIMVASVFVNGQYCGGSRHFDTVWTCDVSDAVKPGQTNEIAVVIKDIYYARNPEQMKGIETDLYGARSGFNAPIDMTFHQSVGGSFDMPVSWGHGGTGRTGLIESVKLVACGPQYTTDVFPVPSVKNKTLGLEVSAANPGPQDIELKAVCKVVPWQKGIDSAAALRNGKAKPALAFPPAQINIPAGETATIKLESPFENPELWWPDDPKLYVVVTELMKDGQIIDTQTTRFGFREWGWKGNAYFTLNGVPWQFWAVHSSGNLAGDKDVYAFVKHCRRTGTNMLRYIHWANDWARRSGMTTSEILDVLDEEGIAVRFNGPIDGEVANYGTNLTTGPRDERTANWKLWNNVFDQELAWVRSYRNHPSLMVWSMDNEVTYINANNLGQGPLVDPVFRALAEKIMQIDPTRPAMVDGGNALRPPEEWKTTDEVRALGYLPVNGAHYIEEHNVSKRDYPDAAYTNAHWGESPQRGAFPVLLDRPIYHGEIFFAAGHGTDRMATIGGEQCFIGSAYTYHARALYVRMMTEGFRWGLTSAAWDMGLSKLDDDYIVSFQPVALFCREWNATFEAGTKVPRTLMLINQSSSFDPLTATWELMYEGKSLHRDSKQLTLGAGERKIIHAEIQVPDQPVETGAFWVLSLQRQGKTIFEDKRPVRILDTSPKPTQAKEKSIVYLVDPQNKVKKRLEARSFEVKSVVDINKLPQGKHFIIIGPDAVKEDVADDPFWQRLTLSGARILVLEQEHPLHHQALPANLETSDYAGRMAFAENPGHPVFEGLVNEDLHFWAPLYEQGNGLERGSYPWSEAVRANIAYKNAYRKATRGGRSLAQCDEALGYSALTECPLGSGMILVSQFLLGEKLSVEPAARRLFDNLVDYTSGYEQLRRKTVVVMSEENPAFKLLKEQNAQFERNDDPMKAIEQGAEIVIVEATPLNMKTLADNKEKARAFMNDGGWIVPWGLTPKELAEFNTLIGIDHLIRPFTMERVLLAPPRDVLSSGLSLRDVVMESGKKIYPWQATKWAADDMFSYIVDLEDIAPFSKLDGHPPVAKPARNPHVRNIVNAFTNKEAWKYIYYMEKQKGMENRITIEMPREEEVKQVSMILNTSYKMPQKMKIYFSPDGSNPAGPMEVSLQTDDSIQHFEIAPAVKTNYLRFEFSDLTEDHPRDIIGVENLWVNVQRSKTYHERVHPLLNIGGLVRYEFGKGGLFLNQINILETEVNPVNHEKKSAVVKTTLGNLGVPFTGGQVVVAGQNLNYTPVVIKDQQYNAYLDHERKPNWFTNGQHRNATMADLPDGDQRLAEILFHINNFFTSPVTSAVMLAGDGSQVKEESVPSLEVGKKADALFFLHAYHPSRNLQRWQPNPRKGEIEPPVLFVYRIRYADGQTVEVPIQWKRDIDNWLMQAPRSLPTAYLAWTSKVEGAEDARKALYAFQWTNPRPDVTIESIEMTLADPERKRWGAPALLAITAASTPEN